MRTGDRMMILFVGSGLIAGSLSSALRAGESVPDTRGLLAPLAAPLATVVRPSGERQPSVPSQIGGAEKGTSATPAVSPISPSEQSLHDWAASIKPDLETFAGAKFEKDVAIKVLGLDDLAQMLAAPIMQRMTDEKVKRPDGSAMSPVEIRIRSMAAAFKVATRTFGMYRYEDKTVYVIPENASRYAKRHGWSSQTLERAPKLAMAHELIHALQDQKHSLGEQFVRVSGEERNALIAVTEGQAVWVTDQLAHKLDWPAANAVLWGVVTGVQTEDDLAGAEKMPKVKVNDGAPASELYDLGKKFIVTQAELKGDAPTGAERVWAIIAKPPITMAEVREPEKFVLKK